MLYVMSVRYDFKVDVYVGAVGFGVHVCVCVCVCVCLCVHVSGLWDVASEFAT